MYSPPNLKLEPGDRILIRGAMRPSFRPICAEQRHYAAAPWRTAGAVPATYDQSIRAEPTACWFPCGQGSSRT